MSITQTTNDATTPIPDGLPIVANASPSSESGQVEQSQAERALKFKYPEFAGPAGERYLLSLAQQFSPFSLWRTWYAAVSYQGQGDQPENSTCYVGVSLLVERKRQPKSGLGVGVRERKIYIDLEAMETRGWLTQRRARMAFTQEDGSTVYAPVTVKDFTGFYDTAYDYHLWIHSPEYQYLAPERENIPLIKAEIKANPALGERLIKFENYRRLLIHQKPGPKTSNKTDFYTCQLEALAVQAEEDGPKVNLQFNEPANIPSSYRISVPSSSTDEDVSRLSTSENESLAVTTIGSTLPQTGDHLEPEAATQSKTNPPIVPREERRGAAAKTAIGELGYTESELRQDAGKRGAAAIGISADQLAKLNGGLDRSEQMERNQREIEAQEQPARPERSIPAEIISEAEQYARQYDDPKLIISDVTRIRKIYATAEQVLPNLHLNNDKLYWDNYDTARTAAARYAYKRRNSKGKRTCVPYFFVCLENNLGFTLEELIYLREDDPLYLDISVFDVVNHLRRGYNEAYDRQETNLEYRDWLVNILDQLEKPKTPKQRLNPTSREYRF